MVGRMTNNEQCVSLARTTPHCMCLSWLRRERGERMSYMRQEERQGCCAGSELEAVLASGGAGDTGTRGFPSSLQGKAQLAFQETLPYTVMF